MTAKQRLALFYLANDVVQTCKRKNARIFQDTFRRHMTEAVQWVRDDSIKNNIVHVLDVWLERAIYDKEFVDLLKQNLNSKEFANTTRSPTPPDSKAAAKSNNNNNNNNNNNHNSTATTPKSFSSKPSAVSASNATVAYSKEELDRVIAEFQPKKLCEALGALQAGASDVSLTRAELEATRLLEITAESIRLTKDKRQGAKFKVEFENSVLKLDAMLAKVAVQAERRRALVQLLEQSEVFYDAQYNDAKTVSNVRSFRFLFVLELLRQ